MSILAKNCDLAVDDARLLSDVSMSMSSGEVVSVIGANGAGKTSLLKLLSGEYLPDSGEVRVNGKLLSGLNLEDRARSVAVLPQRSLLDFPFLVGEVIEMGRFPQMTGRSFNQKVVREVIGQLGLDEFQARRYTTLSGGERQRVQIARVLAQLWDTKETAHYLFDEPTAPLDLAHQLDFFSLIRNIADDGAAVMLVIHDINLAARFSDRIILLKQGRILASGEPEEVVTNENIKSGFDVQVDVLRAASSKIVQISY